MTYNDNNVIDTINDTIKLKEDIKNYYGIGGRHKTNNEIVDALCFPTNTFQTVRSLFDCEQKESGIDFIRFLERIISTFVGAGQYPDFCEVILKNCPALFDSAISAVSYKTGSDSIASAYIKAGIVTIPLDIGARAGGTGVCFALVNRVSYASKQLLGMLCCQTFVFDGNFELITGSNVMRFSPGEYKFYTGKGWVVIRKC